MRKCAFEGCAGNGTAYVADRGAGGWACWACADHTKLVTGEGWMVLDRDVEGMVEMFGDLMAGSAETDVTRAIRADGAEGAIRYSRDAAISRTADEYGVEVEFVRAAVEKVEAEERALDLERRRASKTRSEDYVRRDALEAVSTEELREIIANGDIAAVVDLAVEILATRVGVQGMTDAELARGVESFTQDGREEE